MNTAPRLSIVPQELPAPAYDKHTASNGFGFTLDVSRMHNSDSWAVCPPEIRPWMMATWITSWTQRPCGSLPSDDDLLAARLGCTLDFLRVHRRFIMRGWVLHADDRFYHPVVTEAVLKMVKQRKEWAKSKSGSRANKEKQEVTENVLQDSGGSPTGVLQVSSSYSYSSTSTSKARVAKATLSPSSSASPTVAPIAADAAGVSEKADPAPTPTSQANQAESPSPRSAPKPQATPWPRFDDFWSAYPSKKAKEDARRAWHRLRLPPNVIDAILTDITDRATTDRSWLDGFIPNPATYLNGRRWEDAITPVTAIKAGGSRAGSLAERNAAVFDDFLRGNGTNGVIEGECQRV